MACYILKQAPEVASDYYARFETSLKMDNTDRCTCFVRRISTDVNEEQLLDLFGTVGPVKKAFLVQDKGAAKHKGYGFVKFAIAEDATAAVQKLANHSLNGQRLQVRAASLGSSAAVPLLHSDTRSNAQHTASTV